MYIAKFHCPNCAKSLDSPTELAAVDVECPDCKFVFRPSVEKIIEEKPVVPYTVVEKSAKERVAAHLASIRANSSYRLLRGAISISFALALAAVVVAIIWLAIIAFSERISGGPQDFTAIQLIEGGLMGAVAIILCFVCRQSAFLLIDIADTLLHEHSKPK